MQPPNKPSEEDDDATLMRPGGASGEITRVEAGHDAEATQIPTGRVQDVTRVNPPLHGSDFGPLDTARLQKSPIQARYTPNSKRLALRITLGLILTISWLAALWWYKQTHRPPPPPSVPVEIEAPASTPAPAPLAPETAPAVPPTTEPAASTQPIDQVAPPSEPTPFRILSTNLDELFRMAKQAITSGQLEPAQLSQSATGLLIQMNQIAANDERTQEIRRLLAEAHLQQSKQARARNDWDAAEYHTDAAWKARDQNSYLTLP